MEKIISRDEAFALLNKHNKEAFHLLHARTVEGVMRYFARTLGFSDEEAYWGLVGLLHDIDFEEYPEEHCRKAPELLRVAGVSEEMIHSICSHGYQICADIEPKHLMEKILYATDELTGLIGAAVRLRPSQSAMDLEVSSLKKKFKDKRFAAGCSRETIKKGAEMLGWELDELFEKTILAMRELEKEITAGKN
jgi:predicted hydrolase (HD superfamily)